MTLDQEIYNAAVKEGFSPSAAKLIVAQTRHETGNYTSNVFKLNNNLFGMKFVNQPLAVAGSPSPSNEGKTPYAKYKNASDSVKDAVARYYKITRKGVTFEQLKNVSDPLDFATKLKTRGYYGATINEYANGLKNALTRIKINEVIESAKQNKGKIGIGLILLALSLYLYKKK
jgi:flagellum-specific peptidoglycan hydrolase FlgJ